VEALNPQASTSYFDRKLGKSVTITFCQKSCKRSPEPLYLAQLVAAVSEYRQDDWCKAVFWLEGGMAHILGEATLVRAYGCLLTI
jgi:hypothetical protein